jgi:hypothetical protein
VNTDVTVATLIMPNISKADVAAEAAETEAAAAASAVAEAAAKKA